MRSCFPLMGAVVLSSILSSSIGATISAIYSHPQTAPIKMPEVTFPSVDLDCSRPQGRHVWTGEIITVMENNRFKIDDETVDTTGWVCVIATHISKD